MCINLIISLWRDQCRCKNEAGVNRDATDPLFVATVNSQLASFYFYFYFYISVAEPLLTQAFVLGL